MNETRESRALLEEWGHLSLAQLPADVQARVAKCPVCRAHFERNRQLVALLQLKRHELPDASYEGRLLHRVGTRLQNTADLEPVRAREAAAPEAGRWSWMGPLALAAALVVAVGVNRYTLNHQSTVLAISTPAPGLAAPAALPSPGESVASAPRSITEQQVKDMFAVKATTSNDIDRIVSAVEQAGYEVVVATNSTPEQLRLIPPPAVQVNSK